MGFIKVTANTSTYNNRRKRETAPQHRGITKNNSPETSYLEAVTGHDKTLVDKPFVYTSSEDMTKTLMLSPLTSYTLKKHISVARSRVSNGDTRKVHRTSFTRTYRQPRAEQMAPLSSTPTEADGR